MKYQSYQTVKQFILNIMLIFYLQFLNIAIAILTGHWNSQITSIIHLQQKQIAESGLYKP